MIGFYARIYAASRLDAAPEPFRQAIVHEYSRSCL